MISKILSILGSIRFWIILLGWAAAYLAQVQVDGFTVINLLNNVAILLGVVAGIGSLDSIASRISGTK